MHTSNVSLDNTAHSFALFILDGTVGLAAKSLEDCERGSNARARKFRLLGQIFGPVIVSLALINEKIEVTYSFWDFPSS